MNNTVKPRLTPAELMEAAKTLGVSLSALKAVCDVESVGAGFLADGQPVILFERHVMYRQLQKHGLNVEAWADRQPDIVNPVAGGYKGGAKEHVRFQTACTIHRPSAIEATSWGLFQIMGMHWQLLGYASPSAFMEAMKTGEAQQLKAFVGFLNKNPGMLKALRGLNFSEFARLYNGPNYRANGYDLKLARAFAQQQRMASGHE